MDIKGKVKLMEAEMCSSLQELLKIRSVLEAEEINEAGEEAGNGAAGEAGSDKRPFGEGPDKALSWVLSLCESLGFRTKNCDGYVGWAEAGQGEELFAMLVHLDVVPEGSGWTYPPYGGEIHDGKLYGRGAIDDKGPAIACIYALKAVMDLGIQLNKRVRIIFGLDEESGWKDMEHYLAHEEIPACGFTPDADFPAIYGEKGILKVTLSARKEGDCIVSAWGGEVVNMVPDTCTVEVETEDETVLVERLGKAAHGSMPEQGRNAITAAMEAVYHLKKYRNLVSPFTDFCYDKIGRGIHGEAMGLDMEDEESGKLTMNPGIIAITEQSIQLQLDIRYPVTFKKEDVLDKIKTAGEPYGVSIAAVTHKPPVYMDKNSELVRKLMAVYREATGDDSEPLTMGGGTYARAMPNVIAFGPLFPGRPSVEHQKNEYILLADLMKITEIYARAVAAMAGAV